MISNEESLRYEENNKIYIPEDYNFQDNKYTLSNDTLTIITNNNCTTTSTQTQCDCYAYNLKYNIIMNSYRCNRNPNSNSIINNQYITSNVNDSTRIRQDYVQDYTIIFGIAIVMLLFTILFKRNSRNI